MQTILWVLLPLAAGIGLGWLIRWLYARLELASSEQKARRIIKDATQDAEARKRETLLETKDEILQERNQLERTRGHAGTRCSVSSNGCCKRKRT